MRRIMPLLALAVAGPWTGGCTRVDGPREEFGSTDAPVRTVAPEDVARDRIRVDDVRRHVSFLAADSRRGRGTPGEGLDRSAAWLASEFAAAGLEPAGDHGGYLQYWPLDGAGESGADSTVQVPNVVGLVPAGDSARSGEYVVLVAHYDHLGVGQPDEAGDSIYNGADDNASGVAALMEVARAFGALSDRPVRPVLFLAVSGGEQGRLGSSWFADHPTVDLAEAVAVLNMDMIGRNQPDRIGVVGHDLSTLGPLIAEVAGGRGALGLTVAPESDPARFREGDHFPFARLGIPAVQLFSGLHDDYHTPADEADGVDHDKIARVGRLVFLTAHRLTSGAHTPEWTAAGRAAIRP